MYLTLRKGATQMKALFAKDFWTGRAQLQAPFSPGDWTLFVLINFSLYGMCFRYSAIDGGLGIFQMVVFFHMLPSGQLRAPF